MSIFASLPAPDDSEHEDDCGIWIKTRDESGGVWETKSPEHCTCGQPDAPIIYQGSHVLPSEDDSRGGHVDIAYIPPHVRYWRDNPDAPIETEPDLGTHPPDPFLRFGVNESRVILTRRNVMDIVDSLNWWLNATERKGVD